jgi:HEAT repeat protein
MRRLVALLLAVTIVGLCSSDAAFGQKKKKIDDLLKDLDSKTPATRITALKEIGDLAEIKLSYGLMAMPQIRDILAKEPDVKVRVAALGALGKIEAEPKDYIANMMKYLKEDKDYGLQNACLTMLAAYQQTAAEAIAPLKEHMTELRDKNKDQDPGGIRGGIITAMAQISRPQAEQVALEALKEDKAASVRVTAVNQLNQISQMGGAKDAAPVLIEAYGESLKAGPSPELRRTILATLARVQPDPKEYTTLMIETLKKDKDPATGAAVIAAFGRVGDTPKEAVPLVLDVPKQALSAMPKEGNDPNNVRRTIMENISKCGIPAKDVVPVLVDSLKKDKDMAVRAAALTSIGSLGKDGKDAITPVATLQKTWASMGMKDGNDPENVRRITLETLAKLGQEPKALVPILMSSARSDKNARVRLTAVTLLGDIGPPAKEALNLLSSLSNPPKKGGETDSDVSKAAAEAVTKIKAK